MERGNWVVVRAHGPAVLLLIFAAICLAMLSAMPPHPVLAGLQSMAFWVPVGLVTAGFGMMGMATYRLYQWERGSGHDCSHCGGPLGFERAGHARMGGAYRRCYACGSNVNHRHYQ